jgi:holliday junction DNA helicase RuvA
MIRSISGLIIARRESFVVVETGGIGYKISTSKRTLASIPHGEQTVMLFCHHHVSESDMSLYGFLSEGELIFFEQLLSVSGVGPKSALSILDVADLMNLQAAIKEGRPDLLTKATGVGRKTAERIIIELKDKLIVEGSVGKVEKMETDSDLVEALANLGFRKEEAAHALRQVGEEVRGMEARLKAAFKLLNAKKFNS